MRRDWKWRTAEDDGSILIAIVGIMVVITVLAIGAFSMSDNNLFQSKCDRGRAQALAAAEAGLEQVMFRLDSHTSTMATTLTLPTGTASVTTSKTTAFSHRVIAIASSTTSPTVTRTVSTEIFTMSIWDMFYASGPVNPGANGHINGSGSFYGSLYMRGDWPPSNGNSSFNGGPFFVKDGNVALDGSSYMGTEGAVDLYCNGTVAMNRITARLHSSVPDLPSPKQGAAELSLARTTALGESTDGYQGTLGSGAQQNDERRTTGVATGTPLAYPFADKTYSLTSDRFYKRIDNDALADNKSIAAYYIGVGANGNVLPSFGEAYDSAIGHSRDDYSWDATNRILTIQGTVFIDAAEVYINNVRFAGKGTIVVSGNVHISNEWEPYVAADYPQRANVGISASGYVNCYSPDAWGVMFSGLRWSMDPDGNYHEFHGEIVSPDIAFGKHSLVWCTPNMSSNLPPSLPGGNGQIRSMSGWHEGTRG
jgi:hypothetical protein